MGKINPFTGMVSGIVGTVTVSSWKGQPYLKSNGKSSKPPSEKQLKNQAKMGLVSRLHYRMKDLLEQTFFNYAIMKTGTNAALSYNFKNCISGEYPEYTIDYSRVLVSRGDLPDTGDAFVEATGNGELKFNWTDKEGRNPAAPDDKCIAVVYVAASKETRFSNDKKFKDAGYISAETRKSGSCILPFPKGIGNTVETWLVFISDNGKEVANSVYTGRVVIL